MNLKHPVTVVTIGALVLGVAAFTEWKPEDRRFDEAKNTVLMREIGHTLLLQSGDSTSVVLPVVQPAKDEYQLRFASSWSFVPDSLVSTVRKVIKKGDFPGNYVVNVLKCTTNEVMFGYTILAKEEKQVIPCVGRLQPKNCYYINIRFQPEPSTGQTGKWIIVSAILASLLFVLARFFLNKRKEYPAPEEGQAGIPQPEGIAIGNYFLSGGELKWEGQIIPLSVKEVKLLSIFAASPNQVIDRSRLQKEGWEDEGVIVGRSLDVFISKLRKKLEHDPAVKLVNIHGKGYKLEIGGS